VESVLGLMGLDWSISDFSTLSRRQKAPAVTIPCRGSQAPLNLLIDSTGIKARGKASGMPSSMVARNGVCGAAIDGRCDRQKRGAARLEIPQPRHPILEG
tara:strand:+ start:17114 stop:17413 length:300 start_codon:yes stop_codon:yes gene_type:complete